MRRLVPTALALALALTACAGPTTPGGTGGTGAGGVRKTPKPAASTGAKGSPGPGASPSTGRPAAPPIALLAGGPTRTIAAGDVATLTGKVKLISDKGASIISNNAGAIIANNSGGLISDGGGALVGNNAAGLVANNSAGFRLLQAGVAEAALADAGVTVFDAAGNQLVDAAGAPIAAVTDGQGGYALQAVLPAENLVLKVRLWNGGELAAILPQADAKTREVPIDTTATLGATYVMSQFVKGDQAVFDKLPASEVDRLRRDLEAAKGLIATTPDYEPVALVALTDEIRAKAPAVDKTLTDIKALLLGQANLGAGRLATEVPLADPRTTLRLADGSLLVAEGIFGRIRRIAPDGTITTWLDTLHGEQVKTNLFRLADLKHGPDGAIYVAETATNKLHRIAPDGTVSAVLGNGEEAGPLGATALESAFCPYGLVFGPDGTMYVGENYRPGGSIPRVVAVAPGGGIRELAPSPAAWERCGAAAIDRGADGTLWVLMRRKPGVDGLWKLAPGAAAWTLVTEDLALDNKGYLTLGPDGLPVVSENEAGRVVRIDAGGTKTVLAGVGGPPGTAALGAPSGLRFEADGGLIVADGGANAVWRLKEGTLTRLAGVPKTSQSGANDAISVNGPGGIGFDSKGRMILAEGGNHTIRRLDGTTLETIAGGVLGDGGDGGPAAAAQLNAPAGLDVRGDVIWVLDSGNRRIRKIDAAGTITTAAGHYVDLDPLRPGVPVRPEDYAIVRGIGLAVGPDGLPAWVSIARHQVHRLRPDGQVELVAGAGSMKTGGFGGDGGAPGAALLEAPLGLAYGPDGALYVTEAGNMRIRRIAPDGGTIDTFCGQDKFQTVFGLGSDVGAPTTREAALLAVPAGLCVDKAGNVYVGELGTIAIPLLGTLTKGLGGLPTESMPKVSARVRKIAPDGTVTTIAGPGGKFFTDTAAGDALIMPTGLAIDPQGRLVIVDGGANLIRFIPAGSF